MFDSSLARPPVSPTVHRSSSRHAVPARHARGVIRCAVEKGARRRVLQTAARLTDDALNDLDGWVGGEQMAMLWVSAAEESGDPDFGLHMGSQSRPSELSIVGYLMLSSETLGEAFGALARYYMLVAPDRQTRLVRGGSDHAAALEIEMGTPPYPLSACRQSLEAAMAAFTSFAKRLTGRPLPVLTVAFAHEQPTTGTVTHEEVFGVVPTFGAELYRLAFEPTALRWRGVEASPELHAVFEREADRLVDQQAQTVSSRAAASVEQRLRGSVPVLADVAADLALGERTLQRHLADEGTTFQQVIDDVRRDIATRHLSGNQGTIHEVAFLLGYSEPSAFHRAFKRWTGVTPGAYRSVRAEA
ncbi:AraC family transcriptional regulator [Rubrivirga sp. S365]|uniref:AraC family transcriptional regulator n=1 Tax=Rubrivirga sp. S365 TaxID=3076080 RepID=UPI0028CA2378|nr:AraC family transcriptional regulator [Rubrivirga sp. S365]MDT7858345.1 AraC family transcriptional regulator [Rubrivirga sp. S365]